VAFEQQVVAGLVATIKAAAGRILKTARQVAVSDVIASLAELAALQGYLRPVVDDSERLAIKDGRHPVVEQLLKDERFVPNDVSLNC
jgi:DNA mismatch repair protein MutS